MKKKLLYINIGLMLAVLFAVSYQSIHTFSHEHHVKSECCDDSHHLPFKTSEKTFTESDDCPICDFKFAAFLKTDIFTFKFYSPFKESPYSFSIKEATSFFCGSLFCLRGPPQFV